MLEHLRPVSSERALIQNVDRFVLKQSGEMVPESATPFPESDSKSTLYPRKPLNRMAGTLAVGLRMDSRCLSCKISTTAGAT
jgi:hypothetical protein